MGPIGSWTPLAEQCPRGLGRRLACWADRVPAESVAVNGCVGRGVVLAPGLGHTARFNIVYGRGLSPPARHTPGRTGAWSSRERSGTCWSA